MNKAKIFMTVGLYCLLTMPPGFAQQPAAQSMDQEIEKLEKRLAELKQRKRESLQKQVAALEEELRTTSTDRQLPAAPPRQPAATTPAPRPERVSSSATSGSAAAGSSPAANAASPQSGDKCGVTAINQSNYDVALCDLAKAVVAANKLNLTKDLGTLLPVMLGQAARSGKFKIDAQAKLVLEAEARRADKQVGSDDRGMGTTSLAVRGAMPAVLGWAVENGAAVTSGSGTSYTFRVNPVGLLEALGGQGYITGYQQTEKDPLVNFFRRTAVGLTFDASRGSDPPVLTGSKQQLSAVSFRYQFVNQRDPRAERYQKAWDQFFQNEAVAFTKTQADALEQLTERDPAAGFESKFKNKALQSWVEATNAAIAQRPQADQPLSDEQARVLLEEQLQKLPAGELEADVAVAAKLNSFVAAYQPYLEAKQHLLDQIAKGTLVTFEYTNYREVNAPDISNFRFIAERGGAGGINLTANASLSLYNRLPVGMDGLPIKDVKRIRDFNFALQLDKSLKDCMGLGPCVFAFTGKYQRAVSDAFKPNGAAEPNTKGDIAVGQVKLTIPIKDTGLKLPISFTFANRTELVREREVRGNFGLTFDLDTLFARFKPFTR